MSKLKSPNEFVGLGFGGAEVLLADLAASCWSAPACDVEVLAMLDCR